MRTVTEFPHEVRHIEHTWIEMSDGVRLAARIWLPESVEARPVPAVLEYIPYRKRDNTARRDAVNHAYFAGHGYAAVRVDLRGSGDSEGLLTDEYLPQELEDGLEVLRWIAAQRWCTGSVGIIGISWGGFNGLQLAALEPPELKAIITASSTDDRYADDVHYMGGCLLGDNLSWAAAMYAHTSSPPDPECVGERWRDMWFDRMQHSGLWLERWLSHQRRDAYWKHGSICEDYSRVKCPVFAISGWADGYSNAVFRLLEHLEGPRKGLIGPWGHKYPHLGIPGPTIGFLQECVRFWDHWLKGEENGVMAEPMLRVWMQDSVPPTATYQHRPGRWVAEERWPSQHIEERRFRLERGVLARPGAATSREPVTVQSPLSVGLFAGKWCSFTATPDLPHDQREEDGGSILFQSDWLQEPIEILGAPELDLEVSSNRAIAMLAARISDIAPDHKATRVTYGMLNLTHRDSHEHPEPLAIGQSYRVRLRLNEVAHVFPAGHRIRLSLSTSYWPLAWPPPEPAMLTVFTSTSFLSMPERSRRKLDETLRPFDEAEGAELPAITVLEPRNYEWVVIRELDKDTSMLRVVKDEGAYRLDALDLELRQSTVEHYGFQRDDFNSVTGNTHCIRGFRRGNWDVRTETRVTLASTPTHFIIHADLDAYESGQRVYCHVLDREIERDHI